MDFMYKGIQVHIIKNIFGYSYKYTYFNKIYTSGETIYFTSDESCKKMAKMAIDDLF